MFVGNNSLFFFTRESCMNTFALWHDCISFPRKSTCVRTCCMFHIRFREKKFSINNKIKVLLLYGLYKNEITVTLLLRNIMNVILMIKILM